MTGSTPPTSDRSNYGIDYPFCSPSDVGGQRYISETERYVSEKGYRLGRPIPPGGIIVTCIGIIGKVGIASRAMISNQQINAVIVKPEFDIEFIFDAIGHIAPTMRTRASQQTLPILSKLEFGKVCIRIPPIPEQKKLGHFLSILDSRIAAQHKLVELLKKHKRGLHSAMFGQKCRVVNADGKPWPAWRQVRIGDIFQERSERGGTADELLSVTINNGVKRQADTDKKDSSSEDKSNYKKVLPGDIVYNTMRMWQGASGVSPWAGIVSPAYTVIYPLGRQNTIFWAYAFKYWRLIQEFQKFSQGLTSDTWNLKYPQLSDIHVYEPSIDEQDAIVNILSMLDERVMAAEQELNKMRNLKSGLLQQLFV